MLKDTKGKIQSLTQGYHAMRPRQHAGTGEQVVKPLLPMTRHCSCTCGGVGWGQVIKHSVSRYNTWCCIFILRLIIANLTKPDCSQAECHVATGSQRKGRPSLLLQTLWTESTAFSLAYPEALRPHSHLQAPGTPLKGDSHLELPKSRAPPGTSPGSSKSF